MNESLDSGQSSLDVEVTTSWRMAHRVYDNHSHDWKLTAYLSASNPEAHMCDDGVAAQTVIQSILAENWANRLLISVDDPESKSSYLQADFSEKGVVGGMFKVSIVPEVPTLEWVTRELFGAIRDVLPSLTALNVAETPRTAVTYRSS